MAQGCRRGALLVAIGLAVGCATRSGVERDAELPVGPTEVGVLYGIDVVSAWPLVEDAALGAVRDVALAAGRVRIVGDGGVRTEPAPAGEPAALRFQEPEDWTNALDVHPIDALDGPARYVSRGGNGHPIGTFDLAGRILWRSESGAARLAFGDLERDGALDLVLVWEGGRGIVRLDASGQERWRVRQRGAWSVELADVDRDGALEILHGRSDGQLAVRSADGTLRSLRPLAEPPGRFALEAPRDASEAPVLVYPGRAGIHRVDLGSGAESLFPSIHPVFAAHVQAVRVRIRPDAPDAHAFLASWKGVERSFLALYDASGALLHETVLPHACGALALDRTDPEGDVLAVGCEGRVALFGRDVPLLRRALAARETLVGPDDPTLAAEHRALARAYTAEGRSGAAEPHAWRSLELLEKAIGEAAPGTAASQATLGRVLAARGDREAAEIRLLRGLALATPSDAPDHAELWSFHADLGAFYEAAERFAEAAAHDREALALLPDRDRTTSRVRADVAYRMAGALQALGRRDEASAAIDLAIEHDTFAFGADHAEVQANRARAEEIRAAAAMEPSPASPAPN